MLINLHNLLHLPVFTQSGTKLGKVYDVNIDIDSHCIKSYAVRANFFGRSLLIKPVQIISITKEKIIVDDTLIKEGQKSEASKKARPKALAGVAMNKEN